MLQNDLSFSFESLFEQQEVNRESRASKVYDLNYEKK